MGSWLPTIVRLVWWISVVWLALVAAATVYLLVWWLTNKDSPGRYEVAIESGRLLILSLPAAFGVLVAGSVPGSGLSSTKRIGGIVLLALCIGAHLLIVYLQSRTGDS